jgi:signal peptidase I
VSTQWKPTARNAIFLGIVLPPFTFLYLNKAKLFWFYLMLICSVALVDWRYGTYLAAAFSVICPIHAALIVKRLEATAKRAWFSTWWGISSAVAILIVPVLLVRSFLYEPFQIPSTSMVPSLNQGDLIIVDKQGFGTYGTFGMNVFNTRLENPERMKRGDMYVFYAPNHVLYVKRLMAIPGDVFAIRDNKVYINGTVLDRKHLYESGDSTIYQESSDSGPYLIQQLGSVSVKDFNEIVVPENSYFFMGDNRDNSSDSRYWGFVSGDDIIGQVVHVFSR